MTEDEYFAGLTSTNPAEDAYFASFDKPGSSQEDAYFANYDKPASNPLEDEYFASYEEGMLGGAPRTPLTQPAVPRTVSSMAEQEMERSRSLEEEAPALSPEEALQSKIRNQLGLGEYYGWREGKLGYIGSSAVSLFNSIVEGSANTVSALGKGVDRLLGGIFGGADPKAFDDFNKMVAEFTRPAQIKHAELARDNIRRAIEQNGIVGALSTSFAQTVTDTAMFLAAVLGTGGLGAIGRAGQGLTFLSNASKVLNASAKFGTYIFVTTPGTVEEKAKAGAIATAFRATPMLSGIAPSNAKAALLDTMANSGISIALGKYNEAWETAKQQAEEDGSDNIIGYAIANMIPILGPDVIFSLSTKSIRKLREDAVKGFDNLEQVPSPSSQKNVMVSHFDELKKQGQPTPSQYEKLSYEQLLPLYKESFIKTSEEKAAAAEAEQQRVEKEQIISANKAQDELVLKTFEKIDKDYPTASEADKLDAVVETILKSFPADVSKEDLAIAKKDLDARIAKLKTPKPVTAAPLKGLAKLEAEKKDRQAAISSIASILKSTIQKKEAANVVQAGESVGGEVTRGQEPKQAVIQEAGQEAAGTGGILQAPKQAEELKSAVADAINQYEAAADAFIKAGKTADAERMLRARDALVRKEGSALVSRATGITVADKVETKSAVDVLLNAGLISKEELDAELANYPKKKDWKKIGAAMQKIARSRETNITAPLPSGDKVGDLVENPTSTANLKTTEAFAPLRERIGQVVSAVFSKAPDQKIPDTLIENVTSRLVEKITQDANMGAIKKSGLTEENAFKKLAEKTDDNTIALLIAEEMGMDVKNPLPPTANPANKQLAEAISSTIKTAPEPAKPAPAKTMTEAERIVSERKLIQADLKSRMDRGEPVTLRGPLGIYSVSRAETRPGYFIYNLKPAKGNVLSYPADQLAKAISENKNSGGKIGFSIVGEEPPKAQVGRFGRRGEQSYKIAHERIFSRTIKNMGGTVRKEGDRLVGTIGDSRIEFRSKDLSKDYDILDIEQATGREVKGINMRLVDPDGKSVRWDIRVDSKTGDLTTTVHEVMHSIVDKLNYVEKAFLRKYYKLGDEEFGGRAEERFVQKIARATAMGIDLGSAPRYLQKIANRLNLAFKSVLGMKFGDAWENLKGAYTDAKFERLMGRAQRGEAFTRPFGESVKLKQGKTISPEVQQIKKSIKDERSKAEQKHLEIIKNAKLAGKEVYDEGRKSLLSSVQVEKELVDNNIDTRRSMSDPSVVSALSDVGDAFLGSSLNLKNLARRSRSKTLVKEVDALDARRRSSKLAVETSKIIRDTVEKISKSGKIDFLSRKEEVDLGNGEKIRFSIGELMDITANYLANPEAMAKSKITTSKSRKPIQLSVGVLEDIKNTMANYKPAMKIIDMWFTELQPKLQPLFVDTYRKVHAEDPPMVEGLYYTLSRMHLKEPGENASSIVSMLSTNPGFAKERVESKEPLLIQDFLNKIDRHTHKVADFVGMAEWLKRATKVVSENKHGILSASGPKFYEGLVKKLNQVGGEFDESGTIGENYLRILLKNQDTARLWSPKTAAKNFLAILRMSKEFSTAEIMQAWKDALGDAPLKDINNHAYKIAEQLSANRGVPELGEWSSSVHSLTRELSPMSPKKAISSFRDKALWMMQTSDAFTRKMAWTLALNKIKKENAGLSMEAIKQKAGREADRIASDYLQSFFAEDRSVLGSRKDFWIRGLIRYMSDQNVTLNNIFEGYLNYKETGNIKPLLHSLTTTLVGTAAGAAMINYGWNQTQSMVNELFGEGKKRNEQRDMAKIWLDMSDNILTTAYGGQFASAFVKGLSGEGWLADRAATEGILGGSMQKLIDVSKSVNSIYSNGENAKKAKTTKSKLYYSRLSDEAFDRTINSLGDVMGEVFGIPYSGVRRLIGGSKYPRFASDRPSN